MNFVHTPDAVVQYAAQGKVEEWVHAFLRTAGRNSALSDGLLLQKRYWTGPAMIRLERLERCYGPESAMEYIANEESWEKRLAFMKSGLEKGWTPAPLIAQYTTAGSFSLRDGNNRHELLRRAGYQAYWCVVWCDSRELHGEVERILTVG